MIEMSWLTALIAVALLVWLLIAFPRFRIIVIAGLALLFFLMARGVAGIDFQRRGEGDRCAQRPRAFSICVSMPNELQRSRASPPSLKRRRMVHRQKGLIIRLRAAGVNTWDAQRILWLLESNLKRFEEHLDRLKAEQQIE
jgi:hypothetical protein